MFVSWPKQGIWTRFGVTMIVVALIASACTNRKDGTHAVNEQTTGLRQVVPYTGNPFQDANSSTQIANHLQNTWVHSIDSNLLWAMSHCKCTPQASSKYLQRLATQFGALPQTLVPDIRETILNDPKLKFIDNLPGGLGSIADLFVSDGKIAEAIKESLDEMITKSVPGAGKLAQKVNYRFDLFKPLQLSQQMRTPNSSRSFTIGEQAVIWSHIFAQDNLWTGGQPLAFSDHGFQFYTVLQTLAEWKYMLGLDTARATGKPYGGLTFDAMVGVRRSQMMPYDPRRQPAPSPRFVSGQYSVDYPNLKAVDMAKTVNEVWTSEQAEANLAEQALLLNAAAKAFSRMRPSQQNQSRSIYDHSGGAIPTDAYQLPIAFLPGTAKLLETFFINQTELQIFQNGDLPNQVTRDRRKANLSSVTKLASAMMNWVRETKQLEDLQSVPNVRGELTEGHQTMLELLRMATQTILGDFIREDNIARNAFGISLVSDAHTLQHPSLSEVAETLAVLTEIEQETLPSQHMRQRIFQLYHWMAGTYFPGLTSGSLQQVKAADIIWAYHALHRFALYPNAKDTSWFASSYETLSEQIRIWDGKVP